MNPLRFHALVLETTERCNAKCAMCYQAAGPKGSDIRGDERLPLPIIQRVISEAVNLPELEGDRVHVSGGEGFIFFNEMLTIFRHAQQCGFRHIGATTNAFWAISREKAAERCQLLAQAGVNYLEVSMDHWHLPYVSLDRIRSLLWATRKIGLRVMLRTLSSRSHHMDELFRDFTDQELANVQIANSTMAPVGRGEAEIPLSEAYTPKEIGGCCETLLNLTITPNGNVYPCCAGSDMTNALSCGNVFRDSLSEVVLNMRTDHMVRELIHTGSGEIKKVVESLGYGSRLLPEYSSICHLCWHIFRDDEVASALRRYYSEKQFAILEGLLSAIQATPLSAADHQSA